MELVPGVPGAFQAGYSLPPFILATFAATTLARFFITLLELKPSEQAIILDLFFKYFHGPLKVTVNDPDLQATKLSQIYLPFLPIAGFIKKARKPGFSIVSCPFRNEMFSASSKTKILTAGTIVFLGLKSESNAKIAGK
jgi:hypothetical protein